MIFMVCQYAPRTVSSQGKGASNSAFSSSKVRVCRIHAALSALRRYPAPSPLSHNGLSWCNGYLSVTPKVVKTLVKEIFFLF